MEIKNIIEYLYLKTEFDKFLKNLGNVIESKIINGLLLSNTEILNKICGVLNTKNIIKLDKDVKYNFYLVDGKENINVNQNLNSYKIILKIYIILEFMIMNTILLDLVKKNNLNLCLIQNIKIKFFYYRK